MKFFVTFTFGEVRLHLRKTQINLTVGQFFRDSTNEMQAFLCIRCSKIWFFVRFSQLSHAQK